MDPLRHPDLERLGRRLRDRLEETLEAEQRAARAVAVRRSSLRDRLLDAEDTAEPMRLTTTDGQVFGGWIVGVGADHVIVEDGEWERIVVIDHIVSMEVRRGGG